MDENKEEKRNGRKAESRGRAGDPSGYSVWLESGAGGAAGRGRWDAHAAGVHVTGGRLITSRKFVMRCSEKKTL